MKVIGNKGYVIQATDEFEKRANNKILGNLYYEGVTDKITNREEILFDKFNDIKYQNSLSLARVNELHNDIKRFINRNMTNVSTKYLQDYIGYFTYIRNCRIEHGHYPTSKADAEAIFIEILKTKKNLTSSEVRQKELVLPKPSSRYMEVLKLVSLILKQDNIQDIIYQQLAKDRNQLIDEEDLEVIRSSVYAQSSF